LTNFRAHDRPLSSSSLAVSPSSAVLAVVDIVRSIALGRAGIGLWMILARLGRVSVVGVGGGI
jgi:hypothetical protein